jgi:hypothetical protein
VQLHQCAEKIVVHEPEIWEVTHLRLLSLEGAAEEVVEQLVPLLVTASESGEWLCQSDDFGWNGFLHLATLHLLFLLELHRQTLLHAEAGLAVDLFELLPLGDLLAAVEERVLALPELLLEDELARQEQFAQQDHAEKTGLTAEDLGVLADALVQLQDLLLDAVAEGVVLGLFGTLVAQQVPVELLEQREQAAAELE